MLSDEEIEARKKGIKKEQDSNLPAKEPGKFKKWFKKAKLKIALALGITTIGIGGVTAMNNSKEVKNTDEEPKVEDTLKNKDNILNDMLEKGATVVVDATNKSISFVDSLKDNVVKTEDEANVINNETTSPESNVTINQVSNQEQQTVNYKVTAREENLDNNTKGQTHEQIVNETKQEIGLNENEDTPLYSVEETNEIKSKPAEQVQVETPSVKNEGTPKETKKVEIKTDNNKEISVVADEDVAIKYEDNKIVIEGDGDIQKIAAETATNAVEHENENVIPSNPFEDEEDLDR